MYELAYIFQVLGQLQVGLVYGLAGALFMVFVFMASSQFDMLCCSLMNIRHTAMLLNGTYRVKLTAFQENLEVDTSVYFLQEAFREDLDSVELFRGPLKSDRLPVTQMYLMELSAELTYVLEDCIRHHLVLLRFCHCWRDATIPFMATVESLSTMKLINVLEYFMLTMTELYLYCFLGQILQNQGLKVGDALWKSPWHLCGASYRRRMLIILMNAQRPVRLTGLKLYELNLETYYTVMECSVNHPVVSLLTFFISLFLKVLKAAFSYYTIINKFR
ncbi:AGAP002558-PA-like protein [Anopheles sinensis]|uniref:AGAP002558-PA-like protein n=1 Tax=Anopheles sinensis TaxID=74873 RepID=A0A084WSN7_ANOSI|nr:AGAP002558-PA-like protein [Anopheles sinensis]